MSDKNVIVSENIKQNAVGKLFQEEETVAVIWKIPNFTEKLSDPRGTKYDSPTFVFSDLCWLLSIYPNGGTIKNSNGCFGLFLCLKGKHRCTITCTMSIRNARGDAKFPLNFEYKNDSLELDSYRYGYPNFNKKSTLMMNRSVLLPDDILTIECTLKRKKLSVLGEKPRHTVGTSDDESDATSSSRGHSTLEILSRDFSKLLDGDLYQDVELQCEDHTLKAHKSVLSTRSEVFLAMLQSDMIEGRTAKIEVKDMKLDVCKELLHYIYSGKLPKLTPEIARGLYEAGDRYNVDGLMEPCAEFLISNLTTDNACEMLVLADAHSDQYLKESVTKYILDKDIPLEEDVWQQFCLGQPLLANQVLNIFYRLKKQRVN